MRKGFRGSMVKPLLLDGPLGTEIERRGGDTSMPLWSARALLESPTLIKTIHEDYINAGAEVITTNTFRTQERTLAKAGYKKHGEKLTRLAVQLAHEARGNTTIKVAGSIAPLEECYSPELVPPNSALIREHQEMAKWLYEEGIDVFLIETMNTIREAKVCVEIANSYDIPVWLSFTCDKDGKILSGESWKQAFDTTKNEISALMVNCSTPEASVIAYDELLKFREEYDLQIGMYPNYLFDLESGKHIEEIRSAYYRNLNNVLNQSPEIIGTCCGATPEDTRYLKSLIDNI